MEHLESVMRGRPQNNPTFGFSLPGFTLAELLIALLIIGEIATFTIPKIIYAQQNGKFNAVTLEAAGMISAAFQQYQGTGGDTSSMNATQLTQYFNYIAIDTSSLIDDVGTGSSISCGSSTPCFKLASGAVLHHWGDNFCNAKPTGIPYDLDPDGVYSGTTNGPGKSVRFFLYNNGRLSTEGAIDTNTQWGTGGSGCAHTRSAIPANDPSWFSW